MNPIVLRGDVFYNPRVLRKRKFILSDSLEGDYDSDQARSRSLFYSSIDSFFDQVERYSEQQQMAFSSIADYRRVSPRFIRVITIMDDLFTDYTERAVKKNPKDILSAISEWLIESLRVIDGIYELYRGKFKDDAHEEAYESAFNPGYVPSLALKQHNVSLLHNDLVSSAYRAYCEYLGKVIPDQGQVILYNFWSDEYKNLVSYYNQMPAYARAKEGRAITLFDDNCSWLRAEIERRWLLYQEYHDELIGFRDYDPDEPEDVQNIESFFLDLFSNYSIRIKGKPDYEYSCQLWIAYTMQIIYKEYQAVYRSCPDDDGDSIKTLTMEFFFYKCINPVMRMYDRYLMDLKSGYVYNGDEDAEENGKIKVNPKPAILPFSKTITVEQADVIMEVLRGVLAAANKIGVREYYYFAALHYYHHITRLRTEDITKCFPGLKGKSSLSENLGKNGRLRGNNQFEREFIQCMTEINRHLAEIGLPALSMKRKQTEK